MRRGTIPRSDVFAHGSRLSKMISCLALACQYWTSRSCAERSNSVTSANTVGLRQRLRAPASGGRRYQHQPTALADRHAPGKQIRKISNYRLDNSVNRNYIATQPGPTEGRFAIVTIRGARDAMDAAASARCKSRGRKRLQRTAKSCGPGAATLALRRLGDFPPATGARKAASPGRARISRKTIARGKPGCLGCTCSSTPVLFFARELRAQSAPGFPCALCSREGK